MGEAIVGPLVNKLQEVALREVAALAGVGNDIDSLRDKLMWLHAFVHETHLRSRHDDSELTRVLARQTREAAFQAEDAIDEFLMRVDLSRFQHDWVRAVVAFFASFNTQLRVRHTLARKVAALNRRLEGIIDNSSKYKVEHAAAETQMRPWRASLAAATSPSANKDWDDSRQSKLIGRDIERKRLVEKLCSMSPTVDVICIVGERGVGKATLMRNVYEDTEVRNNFAICAWTSFPQDTSDSVIVQLIYEKLFFKCLLNSLRGDVKEKSTLSKDYKKELTEALQNKSYLLVIDSPISSTKWNKVRPKLPIDQIHGKIVLIVDSWPDQKSFIKLNRLEEEQSRELFNRTLAIDKEEHIRKFAGSQNTVHCDVQDITRGQPLFVVLLAKLLKTKEYDQWEYVFRYIKRSNEQADQFRTILSLCFDDLSDDLKSCLLYFTGFPENTVVNAHQLVRLWMAEGFLSSKKGMVEIDQLGQHLLKELISRALIQLIMKDVYGDVELVAMHENIHTFLRFEAQHTRFMEVHYGGLAHASPNARRLSLQNYNNKFTALTNRLSVSALRSVLCYFKEDNDTRVEQPAQSVFSCCMACKQGPEGDSSTDQSKIDIVQLLQGSRFLRVIDLEALDVGNEFPKEIGNMVHLHYLGVRECQSLKKIPASIGRLANLETLDVRGTAIRELPKSFWKIKVLRYVLGDDLLFPTSTGDLELLQMLGTVSVQEDVKGRFGTILRRKMRNLDYLHLIGLNESHKQALQYALNNLILLVRLKLSGKAIPIDFTSCSLNELEYMQLEGKLLDQTPRDNYPHDILCNLTHLELKSTDVNQGFMDMLASLPVLTNLMLLAGSYREQELVFHSDGFKSLTVLKLADERLITITVPRSALQSLVSLELVGIFPEIQPPENDRILENIISTDLLTSIIPRFIRSISQ